MFVYDIKRAMNMKINWEEDLEEKEENNLNTMFGCQGYLRTCMYAYVCVCVCVCVCACVVCVCG